MSPSQEPRTPSSSKSEMITNDALSPPPLKLNKDSHLIKKQSSSSSSSSSSSTINAVTHAAKPQQRRPVIIYTHSPKVIHTHPKDFMALVQKLTGLSRSDEDDASAAPHGHRSQSERSKNAALTTLDAEENKGKNVVPGNHDENDSSSVVTDENYSSIGDFGQVPNSCFFPRIFEPTPNPYMTNIPLFTPNPGTFLPPSQPFYNYTDPFFFPADMSDKNNEFGER